MKYKGSVPSWVNKLIFAKEFSIRPDEVDSVDAKWYFRWLAYTQALTEYNETKSDFSNVGFE